MIDFLRSLICEKPNCEECPKVKTLEKSVEYWKAQRELSYKSSKAKETEITLLENQYNELWQQQTDLLKDKMDLLSEVAVMEERIEALKKTKGLFYKTIPNCLRIKNTDNKDYVYLGQTFWKLYTNHDVKFRPYTNHYNFYTGMTSASMLILMKCGLIDNNNQEIKTGFTAVEVFDKIVKAVQYHIDYVSDQTLYFFVDNTEGSTITIAFQKGDCESSAGVVIDAYNVYEYLTEPFEDYSVFVELGYFRWGSTSGGHGYAVLIDHSVTKETVLDKIRVGEATAKVGPSRTLRDLKDNNIYYGAEWGLWGTMNENNLFGGYTISEEYKWYDEKTNDYKK